MLMKWLLVWVASLRNIFSLICQIFAVSFQLFCFALFQQIKELLQKNRSFISWLTTDIYYLISDWLVASFHVHIGSECSGNKSMCFFNNTVVLDPSVFFLCLQSVLVALLIRRCFVSDITNDDLHQNQMFRFSLHI